MQGLLRHPEAASTLLDSQWNEIIRQARKNQLLGQLAARLDALGLSHELSLPVRRHLDLAFLTSTRRAEAALWEISTIRRALDSSIPLILLKGCAYVLAGDQNSPGRYFSDIDLLIPKAKLDRAESALIADGWKPGNISEADQRYYREWMHELPPMQHVRRHTTLDLHHAIVPPVSRYAFSADRLLDNAEEIGPGIYVLGKTDRLIHCAVHLIQEGESRKITRDLFDLFLLFQQHFASPDSHAELQERAEELGLRRLVEAATGAAQIIFGTQSNGYTPSSCLEKFLITLGSQVPGSSNVHERLAEQYLYLHSHWMKMPLRLLIPHLLRKSFVRWGPKKDHERMGATA